jgi:phosphoribosyl-ATP pyrophosphohydrolase
MSMERKIIEKLYGLIIDRRNNTAENSYTCLLFERGKEEILNKVVEECSEVVTASRNETKERIIAELADLAYHTLVLMVEEGISPEDVYAELESRFAKPGLKPKQ